MKKRSRKLSAVVLAAGLAVTVFGTGDLAQAAAIGSTIYWVNILYKLNYFDYEKNPRVVDDYSDTVSIPEKLQEYLNTVHVSKASVNKKTFKVGDTLTYRIVLKDNGLKSLESDSIVDEEIDYSSVKCVALNLAAKKSGQRVCLYLKPVRKNADGSVEWKGSMKIRKGMQPGKWIVQSIDVNPNTTEWHEWAFSLLNREQNGNPQYPDLSWGDFKVTGTKADLTAPKIVRLKNRRVSKHRIQVRWKVLDPSGAYCYLVWGGDVYGERLKKTGNYYKITETKSWLQGDIGLVAVDTWGNQVYYEIVKGKWRNPIRTDRASSQISIRKITQKKPTVKPGEIQKITLSMKWKKFKPERMRIDYRAPYAYLWDDPSAIVELKAKNRSKTKWSGTFQLKPTSNWKGTWSIAKICVFGKNSNGRRVTLTIENSRWMPSSHVGSGYLRADLSGGNIRVQ